MRYEAVESMTMETLAKVPLFARVEDGFMHALTQKMQAVNCSIGELLSRHRLLFRCGPERSAPTAAVSLIWVTPPIPMRVQVC